jgi:hypothetical protein
MVLALIVCKIFFSRKIFDVKLLLDNCICNPEKLHFHGVRMLQFNCIVGDANCGKIITVNWGRGLGMAHFFQRESKNSCLFPIEEYGAKLGFCGISDNKP